MKRWLLAMAVLVLCIAILWGALSIQQRLHIAAMDFADWAIYLAFPLSGYIAGRIRPLWLAMIAFITVLAGECLAGQSLLKISSILDPFFKLYEAPALTFYFFILPAMVISLVAFGVAAALAYARSRRQRRAGSAHDLF